MTAVVTDPERVEPREPVTVHCENSDRELLLVDWLNAVVFEMATRRMLFSRFDVEGVERGQLTARLYGETVDAKRHAPVVEVKGATLTELAVRRGNDGEWLAQCVVDV